ncbi:hypothetical protein [Mesobacillus zeae]|uniref:Uncharacterized protein n=1 Tax=Mesobacillus zeae TaxID=1917180 RepID=A0A398BGK8_9BACI|nr:hypothetical protein [Mesobacillus zeae]RID86760.1 hypothetical protein D1970_05755 [Mesobacillus zeae]
MRFDSHKPEKIFESNRWDHTDSRIVAPEKEQKEGCLEGCLDGCFQGCFSFVLWIFLSAYAVKEIISFIF